jgi:hypothetical protein
MIFLLMICAPACDTGVGTDLFPRLRKIFFGISSGAVE